MKLLASFLDWAIQDPFKAVALSWIVGCLVGWFICAIQ